MSLSSNMTFIFKTMVVLIIIQDCFTIHKHFPASKRAEIFSQPQRRDIMYLPSYSNYSHPSKIKIEVFYETLCPGSISFIDDVLRPVTEHLASYLDIKLVPYGHAKTIFHENGYSFECQHGAPECLGNRIHACAIDIIGNMTQAVLYNACLMNNSQYKPQVDFTTGMIQCNQKMGIPGRNIWRCAINYKGAELLKKYGEETSLVHPRYVPYVTVNGMTYRRENDLFETLCGLIPQPPENCIQRQRLLNRYLSKRQHK